LVVPVAFPALVPLMKALSVLALVVGWALVGLMFVVSAEDVSRTTLKVRFYAE
jgi:hypothetical protein